MTTHDILGAVHNARRVVQAMQRVPHPLTAPGVPLPIRVDTPESYDRFVCDSAACSDRLDELAQAVNSLVDAFAAHVSDGHGGYHDVVGELGEVVCLRDEILAGTSVPANFPPHMRGLVRCWHDGSKIYCSVRARDRRRRRPLILTTGSPIAPHVVHGMHCAGEAGLSFDDALVDYLPRLSLMRGGGVLLERIAEVSPALLSCDNPPCVGIANNGAWELC